MLDRFRNVLRRTKRYSFAFYTINKNRLMGRTFVPLPLKRLFIEPVSFCNLACKFCTYPKNLHARAVMEESLFRKSIDQASHLGIREIVLTPINGDVFMDKNIIPRMHYIEASRIKSFAFYTNFVGADEPMIAALLKMKKCRYAEISLYGHDLDSFRNITGRGEAQFNRLARNLRTLEQCLKSKPKHMEIGIAFRTYRSFRLESEPGNELLSIVRRLYANGVKVSSSSLVDNWGGDVTQEDIAGIQMDLTEGHHLYRKGPCGLPFDSLQVTATGKVNACACRDPRGTLTLGDLRFQQLSDIISSRNKKWLKLIEDQDAGRFNDVCASCGFYQSIHDERRIQAFQETGETGVISKEEFVSRMDIA